MLEKSVSGVTNVRTQTVFYLLLSFRYLFIILIRIFNTIYNLVQFIRTSCLSMGFYAKWLLTYRIQGQFNCDFYSSLAILDSSCAWTQFLHNNKSTNLSW